MSHRQIKTAPDLGYALRAEREDQGITQANLAEQADVSVRWLSNFERGKSPRAELIKVMHVARALGLTFDLAREETPPMTPGQSSFPDFTKLISPTAKQIGQRAVAEIVNQTGPMSTVDFARTYGSMIPKIHPSGVSNSSSEIFTSLPAGVRPSELERKDEFEPHLNAEESDRGEA